MKQKNLVLMVVAVGCGLVAAFLTTQINAKPKIETVEVVVALKELPTGTVITKENKDKLVGKKKVAKDALPQQFVVDDNELVDKRLVRAVRQDEVFNPADLKKGSIVVFIEGKDIYSLPMSASHAAAGAVGPGSKVDIIAALQLGGVLESFPLLINMHVLEVNGEPDLTKNPRFPNMSTVSFAVDQEEALLLSLAQKRGCTLELLLRNPTKPIDPNYDIKKVKKLLEDERHPTKVYNPEGGNRSNGGADAAIAPSNPTTPAKPETVRVPVAVENIEPNTPLTADLVKEKFAEKELRREDAEGAYTDLTPFLGKSLKYGLGKGQWLTEALVGLPAPKPAPQDDKIDNLPKTGPDEKPAPKRDVVVAGVETHDVAVHTASGTSIHRYQRPVGGEWKLVKVMTPEEVAKADAARSAGNAKPAAEPDAKKYD